MEAVIVIAMIVGALAILAVFAFMVAMAFEERSQQREYIKEREWFARQYAIIEAQRAARKARQ